MTDEKYDSEINFSKVLFLHINRILMAADDELKVIPYINAFEHVLSPYFDDEYQDNIKIAINNFKSTALLDPLMPNRNQLVNESRISLCWIKFRALMALAERKNLLLEKTSREEVWEIPKEEKDVKNTEEMEI